MKHKLHFGRFVVTLLLCAVSTLSWAYDFEVDGIYYYINYYDINGPSVTVTYNSLDNHYSGYHYSGEVTIPSSVTYSGQTYSVTSIGKQAFMDSWQLTSVTIPNSVTTIGNNAFTNCSSLTSINIPKSVTSIGSGAFSGCTGLTSITVAFGHTKYDSRDNCNAIIETAKNTLVAGCKNTVILNSVTSIGDFAFQGCSSLTSITIPNSVTSIGDYAFCNCTGLTSINIPNSVTSIGDYAFYYCSGLTSVTIPNSVTSIGKSAFYGCSGLTKAEFASIESLCSISFMYLDSNPLDCAHHLYINGSEVTDIVIPESVTNIGDYAFNNCTGLTSVTIPESVTSIGKQAFSDCSGLKSITIPESVTSIGKRAFYVCYRLKSITIGSSVTSIGEEAFQHCYGLTSVTCMAENVPTTGTDVFYDVPLSSARLYVPASALDAYKTAAQWKDFGAILPIGYLYIETDITDQFPVDWQGWNGATGYVGWAAPQVTTNDGRETPACEKFNDSRAEQGTVFTRTLTGLVNGIYRIELYGAAASTKGRDTGIDTEMTSADEGDETAVYLYAQTANGTVKQYIPVHWATSFSEISTAVLNGVEVTDGTVEIGMVSDKKFTNWHVVQIKGVTALVDAVELHKNTLTRAQEAIDDAAYVNVVGSERTALSQAIANYSVVSEQTTEAYQEAINALETATKALTDAKESYDAWANIKNHSFPYASEEKKTAAESAAAVLPENAADAVSRTEMMLPLYRQYAESSAMLEGVEGATDMTSYIKNPKADEAIDASVWQTVLGVGSGGSIGILDNEPWTDGSGSTDHKYFDGGDWYNTSWNVAFKQNVTLPAGRYQLTALGRSSKDVTLTLFVAGKETAEMAHIGASGGLFNRGWEQTSVEFELGNSATVSIGIRGVTPAYHNWMSFSDFRLVQFTGYILSGRCGENLNYILTDDYVLTISGTGAMYDYDGGNSPWNSYRESIASVVIDNSVTSIGKYAFFDCSGLTSITIPESVTSIGDMAFDQCEGLTSIIVASGNTVYDSRNNCNAIIETATNTLVTGCKNTVIPNSVTSIGNYAFMDCFSLTSITIPESVTSIGEYAFAGCSGLTSITIPNNVTSIGDFAFQGCSSLTSITIPNSVTSIDRYAFSRCFGLTSVTIPNSVTSIGDHAFLDCTGLTSITIPNSVTSIDRYAFSRCFGLTSVTIPNSVTSIGESAFFGCSGLTSITIPNSVTSIGDFAFQGCSSLTSITIPNNVTSIGAYTFQGCSGLTSVTIPESVTNIGDYAFGDCYGLTSVTCMAENVPTTGEGAFYDVPRSSATLYVPASALNAYKTAEQWKYFGDIKILENPVITFADANVKAICVDNWDTNGDGELDKDEAAAVTDLREVFQNNKTITSFNELQYFTGLASIGEYAFLGCSGLTSIDIPNSVTSIGRCAFEGCSGLTSITIPNSVTSIGNLALADCTGLTSIVVASGNTKYDSRNNCNAIIETATNTLVIGCKNTVISNSVTSIGDWAFEYCSSLTSINIPNSVTSIGNSAFLGCSGLTSIVIPNSVTSIGIGAFSLSSALTSVTIGSGVTSIGAEAFSECSGLTSINIPNSVTSIGRQAFSDCTNLTSVIIGNSVTDIANLAFAGCSSLTSVTIPESVTNIGEYAFMDCSGLTSVTCLAESVPTTGTGVFSNVPISSATLCVPASALNAYKTSNAWNGFGNIDGIIFFADANVKAICLTNWDTDGNGELYVSEAAAVTDLGEVFQNNKTITSFNELQYFTGLATIVDQAFSGCSNLALITIPNSVTSIGKYAFLGCSGLTSIDIPNNVTSIGSYAFEGCSGLTSITIPESVTSIGNLALADCTGLTSIVVASGNTKYDSRNNCNAIIETATNTLVIGCKNTVIPNSVTSIGRGAFEYCSSLTSINIPNSVTSIGDVAFQGCSSLTSIDIPNSVTNIAEGAFGGCSGLTSINIPNSVTSIGEAAFDFCTGLTSINIPNSVTSIGGFAFQGCSGLTSITIPTNVTSIGTRAFNVCSGLTSVTCLAESVPTTGTGVFSNVPISSATLCVPASALNAYKTAEQWKEFGTILANGTIYIETDVTSQFPIDWQGWNGATGYVGWAAPQVTTNDGRTTPACEKFNDSRAEQGTVFTRTLTGLVNGTYRIELYGAAASTKGRDTGIDSEMTASDEGDETAVYLYAKTSSGTVKQYIPVHWATSFSEIATAVLNEVIVTDGTVEIGMVSDKKFTNWHVVQIKGVTALVDAIALHEKTLTRAQEALNDAAYINVVGSERTALSQAIATYSIVAEQTAEAYQEAINALNAATNTYTIAKESYDAWANFKNISFPYASEAKKNAAETAAAVLPTNAANAVSRTETMLPLYRQYAESSALMEGVEGATNMTSYIKNPKAEQAIDASVWQTVLGEGSGGNISIWTNEPWTDGNGSTNHKYFDGGNWDDTSWDVAFKQNVTLPAGRYQLTAIGRSSGDVTLTLFAGEETAEMAHIGATGGLFNRGWEQTSVEFELTTGATVGIGVRGVTPAYHNWMSFSDFRLVQFPGGDTGVDSMQANDKDAEDDDSIYDLNGRKLSKKPENGYYIQGGKLYRVK